VTRKKTNVKVGIAGWSYPDWKGVVYPSRQKLSQLKFLSQFFQVIEVNSTFYGIPSIQVVERWCKEVAGQESFTFTVKLLKDFTHTKKGDGLGEEDFCCRATAFKRALQPMVMEKRLGALLIQFPYSFQKSSANLECIKRLAEEFRRYPVVIEVRHRSFANPEFIECLRKLGSGFVNIDQPLVSNSMGPSAHVSSNVAYVRFHGRNLAQWFNVHATRNERYDYSYSSEQLREWATRVERLAQSANVVYAIFNNHFRGQEVANALEFQHLWTQEPVRVPPLLKKTYSRLKTFSMEEQPTSSEDLESLSLFPEN
jgi:uncharacterized protein YecE (DUF72 family)